jgi:hypothetical protein
MGDSIVVKNLNLGMRWIKGRKLFRELFLVGLSGEHPLDSGRIGMWSKSILRTGGGRTESLQRNLLGVRRMSSWRVRGRNVDGELEACLIGITAYIKIVRDACVMQRTPSTLVRSLSPAFTHPPVRPHRPTRSVQFVISARPAYIPTAILSTPPKESQRQGLSLQPLQNACKQTYSTDKRQFW